MNARVSPSVGLLGVVVVAVPLVLSVPADADLWWHVLTGRLILASGSMPEVDPWSFTFPGAPWTNHEWLSDVWIAGAWDWGGTLGLLALRGALLLTLALCMARCVTVRWPHPLAPILLVGLPLPMYASLVNLRPQAATYTFVAVVFLLLDLVRRGRRWPLAALPVVFVLWANLHAGFLFGAGLALLGLATAATGWEREPDIPLRTGLAAASGVALLVAPSLNPHGIDLLRYVVTEMGAFHPYLPEWSPPSGIMVPILVLAVAFPVVIAGLARERPRPTEWIALVAALCLSVRHQKFVILVLLASSLCTASAIGALARRFQTVWKTREVGFRHPVPVGILSLAVLLGGMPFWGPPGRIPVDSTRYPTGALAFLRNSQGAGTLWCPLGWGGYVLYHLRDRYRVAIDGRNTTVYPVDFVVEQTEALYTGEVAPVLALGPDILLIQRRGSFFEAMDHEPGWDLSYDDDTSAVFVRQGSGFEPATSAARGIHHFPG
ncbi:MAG: hypothetical protein JXB39_14335 [Deltaproteobacteria bacterium]|nr:hypothetical protein [Deltaproteobacteria bacterium]